MFIVDLIWIVLGIVYMVYKLIKDGDISGKSVLLSISAVLGLILIGYIFNTIGESMDSIYGDIVSIIPTLSLRTVLNILNRVDTSGVLDCTLSY